ncbi:MAG: PDZ domain-containing protein [Clostridia bacterium]|nr:PDZ domain-containing protein [Clostridia bacterium]
MEFGKPKFDKRTVVILALTFFITLSVLLGIACGMLFGELHRIQTQRNMPSKSITIEEKSIADIINYIEALKDSASVIERGEDYKANVINAYLAGTGDPYAYYYTPEEWKKETAEDQGNSYGIGVIVGWTGNSIVISRVMSDSPAARAGIKIGDIMTGVNGTDFDGLTYDEALAICRGKKGDERNFVIDRQGETINISVICDDYTVDSVFASVKEYNGTKIGVIEITQFIYPTPNEIREAVNYCMSENCTGIIFDMRGNPGGLLDSVCGSLDVLLPEGPVIRITTKGSTEEQIQTSDAAYITDLPFVILADQHTASAGELFTACIRDFERAKIIGVTTYGKGCGQTPYALIDGGYVKFTTFYYAPPVSDNYDGIGVIPDIEVQLPEEYRNVNLALVPEDRDTQMIAALDFLTQN